MTLQTDRQTDSIQIPADGVFELHLSVGNAFALTDADATDGQAALTLPADQFDLYLQTQARRCPDLSPREPMPAAGQTLAALDALIQTKAEALQAQGQGHCVYLPPQRQNANCNSTAQGLRCSGALNQTLSAAQCPEMVVLAGNVNLNQAFSSRLFLSAAQHLNLNAAAQGLLVSQGHLNANLKSTETLAGVVVAQRLQNLNLQGHFEGLLTSFDTQRFPFNQQAQSHLRGLLCSPAQLNGNQRGIRIEDPNVLLPWTEHIPDLQALTCASRPGFYTAQQPLECSANPDARLKVQDLLYGNSAELNTDTSGWTHLPRRPLPVPAAWGQGESYVLRFENTGMRQIDLHFAASDQPPALPVSLDIQPRLDCIAPNRNGTFTAYLGYHNAMGGSLHIPAGPDNRFSPEPLDRGQPSQFAPGASPAYPANSHSVVFTDTLSWTLNQRQLNIDASDTSRYCPDNSTLPTDPQTPVRKTFLTQQTLTLSQPAERLILPFNVSEAADLQRRVAINLRNGSPRVSELKLLLNGQPVAYGRAEADFLNAEVPEMLAELHGLHQGQNQLTLILSGPPGAQMQLSIEGFLRTAYIPQAFHSAIEITELTRQAPIESGVLGIKFMEGLQVRLHDETEAYLRPHDLTGISLAPLQALMAMYGVSDITRTLPGSPAENDALEQAAQARTGYEAPNMNLFYELHFAETQDVWELIDQLQRLPFIEEAYPRFVLAEPQTPPSPSASPSASPSYFSPAEVNPGGYLTGIYTSPSPTAVPYDLWLRSTRIMNQNAGLASPLPAPSAGDLPHEGAWDITRGVPSVKLAVLERGVHLNHQDLANPNIHQLLNISPHSTYDRFYHGTQTMGTLGAIHNDAANPPLGQGSVGVAHDASLWHIWAWDNHGTPSLRTKSLCRGGTNGGINCNPTVDALSWAANNWSNAADKVKVILVEVSGGGSDPGTVEHLEPDVRAFIRSKLVSQGISVVLPAGNRPCESIDRRTGTGATSPENPAFIACRSKFPAGKDLRLTTVTETIPAWKDACDPPNAAWAFLPGIGPIILGAYIIGYGNCIDSNKTMVVNKKTVPMPDSGAIVVGGIDVHGARMVPPETSSTSPRILPMNYGKTNPADPSSGHGVDISGPAQFIATSSYNLPTPTNSDYRDYGGSSGAAAVVAGVVALMYSANPNLSPAEVRDILRQTQQALPSGEDTAGMVNAHAAVCQAASKGAGPSPAACQGFGGKSFSIASQRPDNAPAHVQFWLLNNGQRVVLEPGELVGIAFDSGNLVNLQVQLDNQTLPLLELAENYAIYGIPQNLPQGLYDVLLSLGGESETLTQALEVLTDCRSDEVLTDTSWLWYQNGNPRQAVVSEFFLPRLTIAPTPNGQWPLPIWSVLSSQGRAGCVNCTFDFFKTHTLPTGYQVRYGQIAAQSDDTAKFFVNQTLVGESTYSFGASSVPRQFTLQPALFAPGQQAINLQIQGWNKVSFASDNYAAVAARFTLRSCRR